MTTDTSTNVWYAAYGSNLSSDRFRVYLEGGLIPHNTTGKIQAGARNPAPPTGNAPCQIDRQLAFGGTAAQWGGGGFAFIESSVVVPTFPTLGRAWRITLEQFEDVFRQENRMDEVIPIDLAELEAAGLLDLRDDRYGRIELLDRIEGEPVITLTQPNPPAIGPAHISYLKAIVDGLIETWSIDPDDACRYLASVPGNEGHFDLAQLQIDIALD